MKATYIGVDLGGTKFEAARVGFDQEARIEATQKVGVNAQMSYEELTAKLIECIGVVWKEGVMAIGVGVPGLVDIASGTILDIQNLPAWSNANLADLLYQEFRRPVVLDNDVNAFTLGVQSYGCGKGVNDLVGVSLGTGLGCGLVFNGQLYRGLLSGAGEVGMLPYRDGIIESYAGSFLFSRDYQSSGKDIHQDARAGDAMALKALAEFGMHLGKAVKIIMFTYAPQAIVFGGSLSKAYAFFKEAMLQEISDFPYPEQLRRTMISVEEQEGMALIGAACLCVDLQSGP